MSRERQSSQIFSSGERLRLRGRICHEEEALPACSKRRCGIAKGRLMFLFLKGRRDVDLHSSRALPSGIAMAYDCIIHSRTHALKALPSKVNHAACVPQRAAVLTPGSTGSYADLPSIDCYVVLVESLAIDSASTGCGHCRMSHKDLLRPPSRDKANANPTVELLANGSIRSAAQHFGQQPSTVSICREPHAPQHRPWSLPAWSESTLCEGHYLPSRTYSTLRARNQDHC